METLKKKLMLAPIFFALASAFGGTLANAAEPIKVKPASSGGISTGRYITGGIVGSVVGFGIGHAIQRRYMPLGLVFTLGEAAAYTAFFADTRFGTSTSLGVTTVRATSIGTIGTIGLIAALGLHVWEVVDLWVTGADLREKPVAEHSSKLMVMPLVMNDRAPGVGMAFQF